MGWFGKLKTLFGKKVSIRTELEESVRTETSEDSYYTASERSQSNDEGPVRNMVEQPPYRQASANARNGTMQVQAGRSASSANFDMDDIAHALDEIPFPAAGRRPRETQRPSGSLSSPFRRQKGPIAAIQREDEYDDSVFDGLTEANLRKLESRAESIRQPREQTGQAKAPEAAIQPRPKKSGGLPSFIGRLGAPAPAAAPSLFSVESPGTYGYRFKERERLKSQGHDVSGGSAYALGQYRSRFESDHIFSFATTNPHPMTRSSDAGKKAAAEGMAYYEFGDLHRDHISSQNTYAIRDGKIKINSANHGWNDSGKFRNQVRAALRDPQTVKSRENLSISGQLHILDYGFGHRRSREMGSPYGGYQDYATLRAAGNSFGFMLESSPPIHIAENTGKENPPVLTQRMSAKTRAELTLAYQAAVETRYPTAGDVERVARAVLPPEEYDEKQAMWDSDDKATSLPRQDKRATYDERTKARGRW